MEDAIQCSITSWYRNIPSLKKHSFKTKFYELSPEFQEYLKSDGVILPKSVACGQKNDWSDDEEWDESPEDAEELESPDLPDAVTFVREALRDFRSAFVKLNWSSAKDASWILPGSITKCSVAEDVFLLVKSSGAISKDLQRCSEVGIPPVLCLRKYYDLHHALEFRAFVHSKSIVGISQRDLSKGFPFLLGIHDHIRDSINTFFHQSIRPNFPLENYVVDLYIQRIPDDEGEVRERVIIVDFSTWGAPTEPLLFTWEELTPHSADSPVELRLVDPSAPVSATSAIHNGLPSELQNLDEFLTDGASQEDSEQIAKLMEIMKRGDGQ